MCYEGVGGRWRWESNVQGRVKEMYTDERDNEDRGGAKIDGVHR